MKRKVHPKTATVEVDGVAFQCESFLRGRWVRVFYDPFRLDDVLVFLGDKRVQRARLTPLGLHGRDPRMRKRLVLLAVVLAATGAAYLPAIDGEFLFDDLTAILKNPSVTDPFGHALSAWLAPGRKVVDFTFALNHLAVGLDTRGWHLTNIAIHLGAAVLAWLFARITLIRAGLGRPELPALAAAALFALHPLQTESVAYVTQRAESLASGVYLAALLLLLLRDEEPAPYRRNLFLAGAVALHAIGLFGVKPIVATLPAAWLLHSALLPVSSEISMPAWRRAWRRVPAALPLFAISGAAAIWMVQSVAGEEHAGLGVPGLSPGLYLATQLRVIPTYLRLLFWPAGQCADWYFPASRSFLEPAVLGGASLLGAIAALAILAAARFRGVSGDGPAAARAASFGAIFFLVAIAPSSSVVPLLDPLAEHRVYLGALGVVLACAAGAAVAVRRLAGARARLAGVSIALLLLASAGVATARRSAVWSTRVSLWSDAAQKAPQKARVHFNLGAALHEANLLPDALASYYRARALPPDHTVRSEVLFENIVATLLRLKRTDEARAEVDGVLARYPRHPAALARLAWVELVSGRDAESMRAALAALAVDRWNATALTCLGVIQLKRGDVAGARQALRGAAATRLDDPITYSKLGEAEERSGEIAAACAAYSHSAALPGHPSVSAAARRSLARLRCP